MSTYPKLFVNGVDLTDDDGRWVMDKGQSLRVAPGRRATSVTVPGRSGVLRPAFREPFEVSTFTIKVLVVGRGASTDARVADLDSSLEILNHVFARDSSLIEYRTAADRAVYGTARHLSLSADYVTEGDTTAATLSVVMELTDPRWRGPVDVFEVPNSAMDGTFYSIPMYQNSTAPINDSVFIVKGPFTSVTLKDKGTLQFLRYTGTVAYNQALFIDTANFYAAVKSNSTSWSPDVGVIADVSADIVNGGPRSSSSWLTLTADFVSGVPTDRRVYLGATVAAIGGSVNPTVQIRGKAAFL